jgi:predicted nuclease with TOPRIM domain
MSLTDDDLKALRELMEVTIEEKLDESLDAKIKYLPTKNEFFNKMDEVMGELKAIREETTVINHRHKNHEDRIERIETHLNLPAD